MKKFMLTAAVAAGIFLLSLFCAISMFLNSAVDGELYYEIQQELNVSPGVDDETMRELDMLLAGYLAGDETALDETPLFNADEKAHMKDVYNLFQLARSVKNIAFSLALVLLVGVYYKRQSFSRAQLRVGIIIGVGMLAAPFAAAAIWAAIDFDAAFIAMHEVLFTNDLWKMNYSTDLMIRMLPEEFFISIGGTLAVRSAIGALIAPMLIYMGTLDWTWLQKTIARIKESDQKSE